MLDDKKLLDLIRELGNQINGYEYTKGAVAMGINSIYEDIKQMRTITEHAIQRAMEVESILDKKYATEERLWRWARENLTGDLADQFWQIVANGYLITENPEYHQRMNYLKHRLEETEAKLKNVLEKQEPRKVTELHGGGGFCPICHMHALDTFLYCSKCGQKLAWEK